MAVVVNGTRFVQRNGLGLFVKNVLNQISKGRK